MMLLDSHIIFNNYFNIIKTKDNIKLYEKFIKIKEKYKDIFKKLKMLSNKFYISKFNVLLSQFLNKKIIFGKLKKPKKKLIIFNVQNNICK